LLSDHNLKPRVDHRHHAIDAFVAAVTTRGMLNAIARAAGRAEEKGQERLLGALPDPFDGFREALDEGLRRLVVSHRPDHGRGGALHEETAYGPVRDPAAWDGHNVVFRKPITALTKGEVKRIRAPELRADLERYVYEAEAVGKSLKDALAAYSNETGVRRVRVLKREDPVIPLHDCQRRPYKALVPGQNHRVDIYEQPDGTWVPEVVTVFDANRLDGRPLPRCRAHPAARCVMRVHKGDLIRLETDGIEETKRVYRLNIAANRLWLASVREGGNLQARHKDRDDPFRWDFATISKLKVRKARKRHVDELGRVHDPGPPK